MLADAVLQRGWIRFRFIYHPGFRVCGATNLYPHRADFVEFLLLSGNFAPRSYLLAFDRTFPQLQRAAKGTADPFHTGPRVDTLFMPPRSIWAMDWHHVHLDSILGRESQV